MIFSSITFLFFFLPLVLLIYGLAGKNMRNGVLLLASLLFYSWGEGLFVAVMLVSILINYLCGLWMIRPEDSHPRKTVLTCGVLLNLGILLFFKYADFLSTNLNLVLDTAGLPLIFLQQVHLPIGISFFTFQAISYIVDVYRQKVAPQRNLIGLSLYISLFPQLIAGPIVRYHHIAAELTRRTLNIPDFAAGVQRFLFGLAKKVLLANPMGAVADQVFSLPATELSPAVAWIGALCYTLQIYFDFSGYSDMAIGLGRMFGFHFPENFNYPYASGSIREFWHRWHISLSSWFRDYLYIPLGGSRSGTLRTSLNLCTVFLLCGLWHGANWTFLLWGLYHGFFLAAERTACGHIFRKMWRPVQHLSTLLIIVLGWVLFRCETISQALDFSSTMFGLTATPTGAYPLIMLIDNKFLFEFSMAALLSLPVYPALQRSITSYLDRTIQQKSLTLAGCYLIHFCLVSSLTYFAVISLAAGAYNPFIYYRF